MAPIFFDHISTTPLDPRVFEAMTPYFTAWYGNPSSHIHDQGQAAQKAVDAARGKVAVALTIGRDGIVSEVRLNRTTLSYPEAIPCMLAAIRGWAFARPEGGEVVVSASFVFSAME